MLDLFQRLFSYVVINFRALLLRQPIKGLSAGVFWGYTHFFTVPNSSISLGNKVRFRSSRLSNLIGINHPCIVSTLEKGAEIIIKDNCGFSGVTIGCHKKIFFGEGVIVGANSVITDGDWHSLDYRSGEPKEIIIERNVWIGLNSVILKGVRIGENSVIGACSVVTKDIPSNVIAAGNPCRIIKYLK